MCDKLQTSKDGSVDLCLSRLSDNRSSAQPLNSNNVSDSLYKKQRKYYGKDKRRSASDWNGSKPCPVEDKSDSYSPGRNSRRQRWSKQTREGNREAGHTKVVGVGEGGKKKMSTSLNHLLNFTIASPERRTGIPPVGRNRRRNTSHSYNKEEFLQANCQFVVSTSGDYTVHFGDPDKLVDWDCIQQVRVFCHEIPSCPICLYPPRAAKVTRCGHVYCWSCLLHYLLLSEKKWSKCPICNESIYKKDIKSVVALSGPQYKVGDTVTMKLMIREKGTTQVFPKVAWNDKKFKMLTIEDSCVNKFVKLLSATPGQVLSLIIGPERRALQSQLAALGKDEATEECFIEAALEDLKARESELTLAQSAHLEVEKIIAESTVSDVLPQSPPLLPVSSDSTSLPWSSFSEQYFESGFKDPFPEQEEDSSDCHSLDDGSEKVPALGSPNSLDTSEENSLEASTSNECSPKCLISESPVSGEDLVYFYQAFDGQHLYMHPVNTKCLVKEYDGLECCPNEITAVILEMEQFTMSEDIRSRYRSLGHLPLTCELTLCELDLRPPTLSKQTLECFSEEIKRRKQKRMKKKKDERRREKRAETRTPHTDFVFRVPSALELTPEKFHDFLSLASSPSLVETGRSAELHQPDTSGIEEFGTLPPQVEKDSSSPPSFAQALQGKSPPVWPVKSSAKGIGSDVSDSGTIVKSCDEEDSFSVPSFHDAFNEAFETASQSVLAAHKAPPGKPGSKTVRKGRKKLVLFTTGGSRGAI